MEAVVGRRAQLERAIAGIKEELAEPGISTAYRDALQRQLVFFEAKLAKLK